jgi:hypothetical protein
MPPPDPVIGAEGVGDPYKPAIVNVVPKMCCLDLWNKSSGHFLPSSPASRITFAVRVKVSVFPAQSTCNGSQQQFDAARPLHFEVHYLAELADSRPCECR